MSLVVQRKTILNFVFFFFLIQFLPFNFAVSFQNQTIILYHTLFGFIHTKKMFQYKLYCHCSNFLLYPYLFLFLFKIQAENNTWLPICMDWTLWNTTYADLVCQNLGYSSSSALESVPKSQDHTSKTSYVLNVIPQQENILHFEPSKISNCDQFVSISCQEYGKITRYNTYINKQFII